MCNNQHLLNPFNHHTPKIDIIIPTFNRANMLDRSIKSVFTQTYKQYILWVVDDASTDNTPLILKKWQKIFPKYQMQTIKNPYNQGVSTARNKGIKKGQAPWLAFLDSDDEWKSQKLLQQITWANMNPKHPLIHTNEIWIRHGTQLNQKKKHQKYGGRIFIPNLELCLISPSSVMIKRELLNKVGLFNETFPVCEDYELWLKITAQTEVGFINTPLLIKYGGHKNQLSKKYKLMDEWRVRALVTHLNNPSINLLEKQKLIEVLSKKCHILLKGYEKYKNNKNKKEILNYLTLSTKCLLALKKLQLNAKNVLKQSTKS